MTLKTKLNQAPRIIMQTFIVFMKLLKNKVEMRYMVAVQLSLAALPVNLPHVRAVTVVVISDYSRGQLNLWSKIFHPSICCHKWK
jgi:hypothetical protein